MIKDCISSQLLTALFFCFVLYLFFFHMRTYTPGGVSLSFVMNTKNVNFLSMIVYLYLYVVCGIHDNKLILNLNLKFEISCFLNLKMNLNLTSNGLVAPDPNPTFGKTGSKAIDILVGWNTLPASNFTFSMQNMAHHTL